MNMCHLSGHLYLIYVDRFLGWVTWGSFNRQRRQNCLQTSSTSSLLPPLHHRCNGRSGSQDCETNTARKHQQNNWIIRHLWRNKGPGDQPEYTSARSWNIPSGGPVRTSHQRPPSHTEHLRREWQTNNSCEMALVKRHLSTAIPDSSSC